VRRFHNPGLPKPLPPVTGRDRGRRAARRRPPPRGDDDRAPDGQGVSPAGAQSQHPDLLQGSLEGAQPGGFHDVHAVEGCPGPEPIEKAAALEGHVHQGGAVEGDQVEVAAHEAHPLEVASVQLGPKSSRCAPPGRGRRRARRRCGARPRELRDRDTLSRRLHGEGIDGVSPEDVQGRGGATQVSSPPRSGSTGPCLVSTWRATPRRASTRVSSSRLERSERTNGTGPERPAPGGRHGPGPSAGHPRGGLTRRARRQPLPGCAGVTR